jgi:hypothetical protein
MTEASIESTFRDLAIGAMRVSAHILEGLTPEQQSALGGALQAGGRLFLEFGPLPQFDGATLYFIEREGRRHKLGSIDVREGSPH